MDEVLEILEKTECNIPEITKRMNINALLADVICSNTLALEKELEKSGVLKYTLKNDARKLRNFSDNVVKETSEKLGCDEMNDSFEAMADYIYEVVDLATAVSDENRIKVISTLKLLSR